MDTMHILYLVLALICVMASAFFSSSETAFISLQKIRLRHMESQGGEKASRIAKILEKPEKFITTVLAGQQLRQHRCGSSGHRSRPVFVGRQ